jgi:RNA polymerase sigma factor (sigma-70 family)
VSHRQLETAIQTVRARTGPSDPELLERFTRTGDEAAFAALVRRHHPMVLGVCRRLLHHAQDAEDACQAVFLVLARKAGSVRGREALAGWLYRVASRVATKARTTTAKRSTTTTADVPGPDDGLQDVTWREALAVLDEELVRLPAAYRAALVLCYLEGRTQDEAARQLGWSLGTLRGQLERAREKLRARLLRRGISLPAALFGVALGGAAASTAAATAITRLAVGSSSTVPARVAALANEGTRTMFTAKARTGAALVFAAGVLVAVGVAAQPGGPPKGPPVKAPPPPAAPAAKADANGDSLPAGAVLRLGTTRLRHVGLFTLAFTPEGKLVSFGSDYVVRTWDPATGRQLAERAVEKEVIHRFWGGRLSPDGRRLAVERIGQVVVVDVETGKQLASVKLASAGGVVARFSPDGRSLAVVDRDKVGTATSRLRLCDVENNACRDLGRVNGFFSDPLFSPDGKRVAHVEGSESGVGVWDVATGGEVLRYKPAGLIGGTVAFDKTGDVLAVLGAVNPPQSFHYVRISTGQSPEGWTAPPVAAFNWVRFTPDGSAVLCGGRESLQWADPKTGKVIHTVEGWAATRAAFSPDGRLVATGGEDAIRLFDTKTGRPAGPADHTDAPDDDVHGVAVSPDGKWIVTSGSHTGLIHVWDAGGQPKGVIKSNRSGGRYPLFDADGRHLFGGAADTIALVRWEFPGGKEVTRYTFDEPAKDHVYVYHFGLSADGKRLAAFTQTGNRGGGGGPGGAGGPGGRGGEVATLTVWDVATGRRLASRPFDSTYTETSSLFGYGAFTPDLRWYFGGEKAVDLADDADLRFELPAGWSFPRQAAVSPDGRLVAQVIGEPKGEDRQVEWKRIFVHEVATGKLVATVPAGFCGPIAFTPDGRGLITTNPDAITRWDLATRQPVVRHKSPAPFTGNYGNSFASSLTVTPDGKRAVTGHRDTTALVWDMTAAALTAKRLSEAELTAAWADLAEDDAAKAYAAVWALADAPAEATPFLRASLRPVAGPPAERVRALIAKLDAATFAEREAAEKDLRELGDTVRGALQAALQSRPSTEQKARLERLAAAASSPAVPSGDRLRHLRALAVLELIGTNDARKVLTELAGGAAGARATTEAAAAVERLSRRTPRG